jgi:hypothetical protein
MSGFSTAVILLAVAAVVAAVVLGAVSSRRRFDEPSERVRPGNDSYPTGSRPAGPGAEGCGSTIRARSRRDPTMPPRSAAVPTDGFGPVSRRAEPDAGGYR